MSVGTFGTIRSADVDINNIDMFYTYASSRENISNTIIRLNPSEILSYNYLPNSEQIIGNENLLEGMYNMRLPASTFNQLGIYSIYIRPKVNITTIIDCSVLSSLPTVKGIVLDVNSLPENLRANNAMQGFKIEYINADGTKLRNTVRYVVTSNRVVPISQNVGNSTQKAIRYRFDDSGTLLFLQVTPSSSSNVKANVTPFIGNPGQTILLSNTNFTPLMVEVELVENTIDTIMDIVAGESIKDVDNGILTYYDKDRNITRQFNLFEIKDDVADVSLFEVKERRENIDSSQNFEDIIEDVT
jgi:hypothetical protein